MITHGPSTVKGMAAGRRRARGEGGGNPCPLTGRCGGGRAVPAGKGALGGPACISTLSIRVLIVYTQFMIFCRRGVYYGIEIQSGARA